MSISPSLTPHIAVALSGGVDSAMSVNVLQRYGYTVQGYTMSLWNPDQKKKQTMRNNARRVADFLGIEHHIIDLESPFRDAVVSYFQREYLAGRTPNPCVQCNRHIKLGAFWDAVRANGATHLATGHYAQIVTSDDNLRIGISMADDLTKDQSYFLYAVGRETLRSLLFPLANAHKHNIKAEARTLGIYGVIDDSESQEICFVPNDDYRDLLRELGAVNTPGPFLHASSGRILGEHQGIWNYTVGQRKGLGVSYREPLYVTHIDPTSNTIYLDTLEHLATNEITVSELNWQYGYPLDLPLRGSVKLRYRSKPSECIVEQHPYREGCLRITTDNPVSGAVTPGQAAVVYNEAQVVVCGGTIAPRRECGGGCMSTFATARCR